MTALSDIEVGTAINMPSSDTNDLRECSLYPDGIEPGWNVTKSALPWSIPAPLYAVVVTVVKLSLFILPVATPFLAADRSQIASDLLSEVCSEARSLTQRLASFRGDAGSTPPEL